MEIPIAAYVMTLIIGAALIVVAIVAEPPMEWLKITMIVVGALSIVASAFKLRSIKEVPYVPNPFSPRGAEELHAKSAIPSSALRYMSSKPRVGPDAFELQ
jgi:hypothetical protein